MEPGELDSLVAKAKLGKHGDMVELLQSMRTHKIHQPEIALLHGARLLTNSQSKLGSDVWTIMEQVFLAACELGADDWRSYTLRHLTKRFPTSTRVERLKGIGQESIKDWGEAKKTYDKLLKDKPEDTVTHKRLIAMFKQRGQVPEAVQAINTYLETFSTDCEVWHELAELYIEHGLLQRAVFCFEELMVANPRSMYNILTYAELLYSTGELELSRKYFALAAHLDGACLRALWGLVTVNSMLAEKDKANEKMAQLQTFAIDRLKAAYKKQGAHGKLAITLLSSGQL